MAVESEAADRLQCDFGRQFRREAEIEEAAGLGAHLAIFRQVAPGLPHHPERRHVLPTPREHIEKGLRSRNRVHVLAPRACQCGHRI